MAELINKKIKLIGPKTKVLVDEVPFFVIRV